MLCQGVDGTFSIYTGSGKDVAAGGRVDYIKQDLAFAEVLDTVVAVNATHDDSGGNQSTR